MLIKNKLKNSLLFILIFLLGTISLISPASYAHQEEVYLGGIPLGIKIATEGVIITGKIEVITDDGAVMPMGELDILPGDILIEIDEIEIMSARDIGVALSKSGTSITLKIKRGDKIIEMKVVPVYDSLNKEKRIGLSVREDICGIGTLTYIKTNGRFGALGHAINDESNVGIYFQKGSMHKCSILSIIKGRSGVPGELQGIFNKNENIIGKIEKNTSLGIFGWYSGVKDMPIVKLGSISQAKTGKAYIYATISGDTFSRFEIEIQKIMKQDSPKEKGLIIKITDEDMLEQTNGILQGMSGSPIVQNGYLIGAVTHVFLSDPTRGYGIFIDWMINK